MLSCCVHERLMSLYSILPRSPSPCDVYYVRRIHGNRSNNKGTRQTNNNLRLPSAGTRRRCLLPLGVMLRYVKLLPYFSFAFSALWELASLSNPLVSTSSSLLIVVTMTRPVRQVLKKRASPREQGHKSPIRQWDHVCGDLTIALDWCLTADQMLWRREYNVLYQLFLILRQAIWARK